MVESTNNQQINTFVGGMDLDTSNAYLSENTYREAYNLRLSTDANSNTGMLHNIEGVKFDISFALSTVGMESFEKWRIIWTGTIRNYGVIIAKSMITETNITTGRVGIFRFNHEESQEGHPAVRVFCSKAFTVNIGTSLSCVTRYEDEDNIKLYVADGISSIRTWNIAPSNDAFNQGLTDDSSISIYPSVTFSKPEFLGFGKGLLPAGTYQYGYQLFNKNGSETEVSPLTGLIYVNDGQLNFTTSTQCVGTLKGKGTNKSVKLRIDVPDKLNYTRIKIVSVFWDDRTSVPVIQVLQDTNIPESGTVVYEDLKNKGVSTLTLEEFNMVTNIHFAPKLLESKNNYLFASNIKYLDNTVPVDYDARAYRFYGASTSNKADNICILNTSNGNTSSFSQSTFETINWNIDKEHDCINPYNDTSKPKSVYYSEYYDKIGDAAKGNTELYSCNSFVDGNYNIIGGTGKNITYRFIVGDLEESTPNSFTGILNNDNLASTSGLVEGMWVSNVTPTGEMVNTRFIKVSNAENGTKNYSNPQLSYSFKSLQRDEIYRYGIILYDKYGLASSAQWIGDIRTPSMSDPGFETFQNSRYVSFTASGQDGHVCELAVRPLAIEFEVKNLPSNIVSYEIVRCERTNDDRSILTQGIFSFLGLCKSKVGSEYLNKIYPPTIMHCSTSFRHFWTNFPERDIQDLYANPYLMFTSPEISYAKDSFKNYINDSTLKLETKKSILSCLNNTPNIPPESRVASITGSFTSKVNTDKTHYGEIIQFPNGNNVTDAYWKIGLDTTFNVFKPYYQSNYYTAYNMISSSGEESKIVGDVISVSNAKLPKDLNWSDYGSRNEYAESFDGYNFINWIEDSYGISSFAAEELNPTGPNGRCLLLKCISNQKATELLKIPIFAKSSQTSIAAKINYDLNSYISDALTRSGLLLCNLKRTVVPYGGDSYQSRQFSKYITNGSYKVKADTNKIDVFDGDTFIGCFDYIKTHYGIVPPDQTKFGKQLPAPVIYYIPVESSINLALTNQEEYHRIKKPQIQLEPGNINGLYIQSEPSCVYNPVYSVQATSKEYMSESQYDEFNKAMDVRTYHSEPKTNDEIIDSWAKFKPLNYIDVDTRYGSINNIRTFGNELIFWQDHALGKFSVLERTTITDDNNAPLLLGTGGVLSRYDYVATSNGIRPGHHDCDTQSDTILYWFDQDKQEVCAYSGNQVVPLSKVKKVQSYIKRLCVEKNDLRTTPFLEYDKIYNELLCFLSKKDTLVYNEAEGVFTSFFTIVPDYAIMFSRNIFLVKDNSLYHFNSDTVNTDFDGKALPIEFKYVVNKAYNNTKVFDNVEFTGLLNKDNILGITCNTETMTGDKIHPSDISDREYNFRFAVPRVKSTEEFPNRLRGRYMECLFNYNLLAQSHAYIVSNEDEYLNTYNDKAMITNRPTGTGTSSQVSRQLNYYTITGTDAETFEIPYIRTTFRVSKS